MRRHFKGHSFPAEVIMNAVYLKNRFSLSYRDIEEILSLRNIIVDHSTIARWVSKFSPLLKESFRKKKKYVGCSWRMDETYIKVKGTWMYLYRATDSDGMTIDVLLRSNRDTTSAFKFFQKAINNNGVPDKINIDKSGANTAGINKYNEENETNIEIRQNKYLNNRVEQDHRFIKKLTRPMLGFKEFNSAKRTLDIIETIHMIKKGQMETNGTVVSIYDQFLSLVA